MVGLTKQSVIHHCDKLYFDNIRPEQIMKI